MLRSLVLSALLLSGGITFAQKGAVNPQPKSTQKLFDTSIHYDKVGAPLPYFQLASIPNKTMPAPIDQKSSSKKEHKKHKKQATIDAMVAGAAKDTAQYAVYTNKDFDMKGNFFVMMFNPTCGHCADMTQLLEKNMPLFKHSKLMLMASPGTKEYLPSFIKTQKTDDYPYITVGYDSADFIKKVYLYQALPQIDIYNSDHKLIRIFTGEVPIDSIKQYIQ